MLYLLSSYCTQLKSYMLAELLILLSSFLRLSGALKLIRMEIFDGISTSEKQHSPVCLYIHTSGPSPQKQRSFCQELVVAACLSRLLVDGQGLTLRAWRVFLPWCRLPVCVKACFQYAKRVWARGRAGEVRQAHSWYFVNTLVQVR